MSKLLIIMMLMLTSTGFCLRQQSRQVCPEAKQVTAKHTAFVPLDILK